MFFLHRMQSVYFNLFFFKGTHLTFPNHEQNPNLNLQLQCTSSSLSLIQMLLFFRGIKKMYTEHYSIAETWHSRRWERDNFLERRKTRHSPWTCLYPAAQCRPSSLDQLPNRRSVQFRGREREKKKADKWWTPWPDNKLFHQRAKKCWQGTNNL